MAEDKTLEVKKEKSAKKANKKPNIFKRISKFFKELKSEVSKVVWPSPKQVLKDSVTVLVIVAISGVFVFVVDSVFKLGIGLALDPENALQSVFPFLF